MDMLECAITQVPLRPEEARRCEVCGRIVRKDLAVLHDGKWMCIDCYHAALRKSGKNVAAVELAVARL